MKKNILFLCTGNSCRSQMAEGFVNNMKKCNFVAYSAGISAKGVDPLAIKVMKEKNIDISNHKSKTIGELTNINFDLVVTVCDSAKENCPILPQKVKKIALSFDDPPTLAKNTKDKNKILNIYRRVRDEIEESIEKAILL